MFRRAASSFGRLATGIAGVQIGAAAAVAISDKDLSKKPEWYQHAVNSLEDSLKKLSKKGYIESESTINEAHEALSQHADVHNSEIQWRIARVLVEKADFTKCPKEKAHLLHEAKDAAKKALAVEPAKGSAGAHKWYAIILLRLHEVEPKSVNLDDVTKHFEDAVAKDSKDPYALTLLGIQYYNGKSYDKAIDAFSKAEGIKANFSANNKYYLGLAQKAAGKKEDAIKSLKSVLEIPSRNRFDGKARSGAKGALGSLGLKPEEYEVEDL